VKRGEIWTLLDTGYAAKPRPGVLEEAGMTAIVLAIAELLEIPCS